MTFPFIISIGCILQNLRSRPVMKLFGSMIENKRSFFTNCLNCSSIKKERCSTICFAAGRVSVWGLCTNSTNSLSSLPLFSVGHIQHVKSGSKVENEVHLTLYCAKKGLMGQPCPTLGCLFQCIKAAVLSCDSTKLSQMNHDTRQEKEHISLLK